MVMSVGLAGTCGVWVIPTMTHDAESLIVINTDGFEQDYDKRED